MKSIKKNDSDSDDFTGTSRGNVTHRSKTDPDARLMRKGLGKESMLCHLAGVIAHATCGFDQTARVGVIREKSEVDLALEMAEDPPGRSAFAADKGYDCGKMRRGCGILDVEAHPDPKSKESSVCGRTKHHASFRQGDASLGCIPSLFYAEKACASGAGVLGSPAHPRAT